MRAVVDFLLLAAEQVGLCIGEIRHALGVRAPIAGGKAFRRRRVAAEDFGDVEIGGMQHVDAEAILPVQEIMQAAHLVEADQQRRRVHADGGDGSRRGAVPFAAMVRRDDSHGAGDAPHRKPEDLLNVLAAHAGTFCSTRKSSTRWLNSSAHSILPMCPAFSNT
jgi:hypothetical protein